MYMTMTGHEQCYSRWMTADCRNANYSYLAFMEKEIIFRFEFGLVYLNTVGDFR
jgi:hypothetical protein